MSEVEFDIMCHVMIWILCASQFIAKFLFAAVNLQEKCEYKRCKYTENVGVTGQV